jgi:hypothetical protein
VARSLEDRSRHWAAQRFIKIDVGHNRRADEQRFLVRIVTLKLDSDREPLDDLDEVARGILRRQQGERRSGSHGDGSPFIVGEFVAYVQPPVWEFESQGVVSEILIALSNRA